MPRCALKYCDRKVKKGSYIRYKKRRICYKCWKEYFGLLGSLVK